MSAAPQRAVRFGDGYDPPKEVVGFYAERARLVKEYKLAHHIIGPLTSEQMDEVLGPLTSNPMGANQHCAVELDDTGRPVGPPAPAPRADPPAQFLARKTAANEARRVQVLAATIRALESGERITYAGLAERLGIPLSQLQSDVKYLRAAGRFPADFAFVRDEDPEIATRRQRIAEVVTQAKEWGYNLSMAEIARRAGIPKTTAANDYRAMVDDGRITGQVETRPRPGGSDQGGRREAYLATRRSKAEERRRRLAEAAAKRHAKGLAVSASELARLENMTVQAIRMDIRRLRSEGKWPWPQAPAHRDFAESETRRQKLLKVAADAWLRSESLTVGELAERVGVKARTVSNDLYDLRRAGKWEYPIRPTSRKGFAVSPRS